MGIFSGGISLSVNFLSGDFLSEHFFSGGFSFLMIFLTSILFSPSNSLFWPYLRFSGDLKFCQIPGSGSEGVNLGNFANHESTAIW